jgi:hypothetical protein
MLAAPTLVAAVLAAGYVIVSPPSLDLAAHLFRAQLFAHEGFGIWNDLWYSGHNVPSYSVFFPAASAALTPQLAGAIAAVATTPLFTALAWRHRGRQALAGTLLFGAFTAVDLFTGRLPFAFGLLPATGAILALDAGWWPAACVLAALSALCSPVTGLAAALVAGGYAAAARVRQRRAGAAIPGASVSAAGLAAIATLAIVFPEGGTEPFELGTLLPVLAVAVIGSVCVDRRLVTLRACLVVYAAALIATYLVASPVGSNVARLGTLLAAPVATVALWDRRPRLLAAAIVPLLYIGCQAPVQNVVSASDQPSTSVAFYRPLLSFLAGQDGPPFRIEIPLTALHWEAYRVATRFPIARGWERQLDIRDNPIFYHRGALTAASYRTWLHAGAVRFVAVPDTSLDASGKAEAALVLRGLPYLRLVRRAGPWRIYAVRDATPLAVGPARLTAVGPDWLALRAARPGAVVLHVHWSPYWELTRGAGCVERDGDDTRIVLRDRGPVRLQTRFGLGRIAASSPRCT